MKNILLVFVLMLAAFGCEKKEDAKPAVPEATYQGVPESKWIELSRDTELSTVIQAVGALTSINSEKGNARIKEIYSDPKVSNVIKNHMASDFTTLEADTYLASDPGLVLFDLDETKQRIKVARPVVHRALAKYIAETTKDDKYFKTHMGGVVMFSDLCANYNLSHPLNNEDKAAVIAALTLYRDKYLSTQTRHDKNSEDKKLTALTSNIEKLSAK